MSVFQRFHPNLQAAIAQRLGWSSLREVQEWASSAILDGHNAVVLAPTAGGKTEAAFFPILSELIAHPQAGTQCVYISPIRALLNNQEERLGTYTEMVGLRRFKWHGEAKKKDKKAFIQEPAELLMITPESLEVMLISGSVPHAQIFANLRYVVVDEIHALADCDRGGHLLSILERLRAYSQYDFQRIGLSATVGNFEDILGWLQGSSKHPQVVINPPKPPSKKKILIKYLEEDEMRRYVAHKGQARKSLFFTDSRSRAEKVGQALKHSKIDIYVHHSSISREARELAEAKVAGGHNVAIVCTSTLELGIDVGELDLIFQAEAPSTVASFLQRMGRTGRRPGAEANTTFLTTTDESLVQAIALVELAREHWVENVRLDRGAWHLLVHQLMAMCLQYGALTRQRVWRDLKACSAFAEIHETGFHQLVDYLIQHDFLCEESGLLSMGLEAEKTFGKRNFMELYSVFTSPVDFKVMTQGGKDLGRIEWQFADVIEIDFCFTLAGKSWMVKRIEFEQKTIIVDKAPAGKAPKWGGYAPRLLNYHLCRKIKQVYSETVNYPYLDESAKLKLLALRQDRYFLGDHFAPLYEDDKQLHWWTFAGGRVNNTLKYTLQHLLGCQVIANNYEIKVKLEECGEVALRSCLKEMVHASFWQNPKLLKALALLLPEHRLSKFQDCLPLELQAQLLAHEFLDVPGTIHFLEQWRETDAMELSQ